MLTQLAFVTPVTTVLERLIHLNRTPLRQVNGLLKVPVLTRLVMSGSTILTWLKMDACHAQPATTVHLMKCLTQQTALQVTSAQLELVPSHKMIMDAQLVPTVLTLTCTKSNSVNLAHLESIAHLLLKLVMVAIVMLAITVLPQLLTTQIIPCTRVLALDLTSPVCAPSLISAHRVSVWVFLLSLVTSLRQLDRQLLQQTNQPTSR